MTPGAGTDNNHFITFIIRILVTTWFMSLYQVNLFMAHELRDLSGV